MKGKISETLKNLFDKLPGKERLSSILKGVSPVVPAVCLAILMVTTLTGYEAPQTEKYNASAADVEQIKTALASQAASSSAAESTTAKKEETAKGSFDLKDGEYEGSANGYGGTVKVKVTIKDKSIKSIDIVSASGETDSFFSRAKGVIDKMISAQSVDVDVVSGATYSSNGIIGAVKNALYGTESESSTAASSTTSGSAQTVSKVDESGEWKDGTYTGSGKGFGGNISVKVTVKDGKITKIQVTSASGEGSSYLSKAKGLISKMIKKQTTNVDAASGATYSSNGLIKAVRNALSKAKTTTSTKKSTKKSKKKKKNKKKKKSSSKKNTTKKTTATPDEGASVPYIDGTYEGSAEGFGGTVTVKVTIKDGKITGITATGADETADYFSKAVALLDDIVKKQSADVDVVSGATYSSNGLINAVKAALQKAKSATDEANKSTTEKKAETTTATTTEKKDETTTEEESGYNDGTYKSTSYCKAWGYNITVEITVKDNKITALSGTADTDDEDNLYYFEDALSQMKAKITEKGSTDGVDAECGATYSAKTILEAVKNALASAKK